MKKGAVPVGVVARIIIVLLLIFLSIGVLTKLILPKFFTVKMESEANILLADPFFYEKLWKENFFIPYEGFFPENLKEFWGADCDIKVKSEADAYEQFEKIARCKYQVALALELWEHVKSKEKLNLSYLKEYGFREDEIENMEEAVREARFKYNQTDNPASKSLAAEIIKGIAKEIAVKWIER